MKIRNNNISLLNYITKLSKFPSKSLNWSQLRKLFVLSYFYSKEFVFFLRKKHCHVDIYVYYKKHAVRRRNAQRRRTCQKTGEENSQGEPLVLPNRRIKPADISPSALSVPRSSRIHTHVHAYANAYQLTRAATDRACDVRNRG